MGKYFGLGEDWDKLTSGYSGGGERTVAGLKLLGKSLINVGNFAVTEMLPGMVEQAAKKTSDRLENNRSSMTEEQIEQAEKFVKSAEAMAEKRKNRSS